MEILVNRSTNAVTLGTSFLTTKLDLSSMDPLVESVIWDTETEKGTKFFSTEAVVDGYLRPQEQILMGEYQYLIGPIVELAMDHWDARKNPYVMYRTSDQLSDGEYTGQKVLVTTYPHPTTPPVGFTLSEPPNPDEQDSLLQWTGSQWYRAPFAFDADFTIQKQDLRNYLLARVADVINNQLRIHTVYDIIEFGKTLRPADSKKHGHETMQDYETAIRSTIVSRMEQIDLASADSDLLTLNYDVSDLF